MDLNVLIVPGDGIGTEVTREAVRVLEHVCRKFNHKLNLTRSPAGRHCDSQDREPVSR